MGQMLEQLELWGNAHQVTHKHTLGDVPGLNLLLNLNVGPFKSGGSDGTPNAGATHVQFLLFKHLELQ